MKLHWIKDVKCPEGLDAEVLLGKGVLLVRKIRLAVLRLWRWDSEMLKCCAGNQAVLVVLVRPPQIGSVAFGHPPKMAWFQLGDDILIQCHSGSLMIYTTLTVLTFVELKPGAIHAGAVRRRLSTPAMLQQLPTSSWEISRITKVSRRCWIRLWMNTSYSANVCISICNSVHALYTPETHLLDDVMVSWYVSPTALLKYSLILPFETPISNGLRQGLQPPPSPKRQHSGKSPVIINRQWSTLVGWPRQPLHLCHWDQESHCESFSLSKCFMGGGGEMIEGIHLFKKSLFAMVENFKFDKSSHELERMDIDHLNGLLAALSVSNKVSSCVKVWLSAMVCLFCEACSGGQHRDFTPQVVSSCDFAGRASVQHCRISIQSEWLRNMIWLGMRISFWCYIHVYSM